jgi:hypothetical protein
MRTKLTHTIIIALLSSLCTTISAKDLNPAYCSSIPLQTNGWNEAQAKATLTGIPTDVAKVWVAFTLDESWSSWADVAYTWTPGSTTIVTARIVPSGAYWKAVAPAWPGGAASYNKPGFVAFCLWSPTNTDAKNQDCTARITPLGYDYSGPDPFRPYCDNFRACMYEDKKTVKMSGLYNYTPGNWFAYSDDGWASYADITPTLAPGQDTITVDFSQKKYTSGPKMGLNIETPLTGKFSMMADATGPGKCTADNKGGNDINGIDMTTAPVCKSNAVNVVVATSVAISPNPATPSETITIKGQYAADAKIIILSASGSIVGSVIPSVGSDAMAVSLSGLNLQAGIYFIRIESGEKVYSGKLCVK